MKTVNSCPQPCPENKSRLSIRNLRSQNNSTTNTIQSKSGTPDDSHSKIENGFNATDSSKNTIDVTASPVNHARATICNHDNQSNTGVNVIAY